MRYFSATLLLLSVSAVVNGQYFCNAGTHDPSLKCSSGQFVYCCDGIGLTQEDPTRKQGFPTYRSCRQEGNKCTVKNNAGTLLYGFASCC
ncbi:uncharacterized protein EKO05_0001161 [Ascochyta rabiei]|uniref:uncharacterized protein n=1 Tax=Didymella rabiei TaxID=5454 RepID=UPI002203882E|nr:uncharacterized protein EKO05_0001161 [Ascochyta rabiei]UPX10504.1 hypothetical protein EKO05_0001161 [Ascochyta rabiei]